MFPAPRWRPRPAGRSEFPRDRTQLYFIRTLPIFKYRHLINETLTKSTVAGGGGDETLSGRPRGACPRLPGVRPSATGLPASYDGPVRRYSVSSADEDREARGHRGIRPRSERSALTTVKPWWLCARRPFCGCEPRVEGRSLPLNRRRSTAGEVWSKVCFSAGKELSLHLRDAATLSREKAAGWGGGRTGLTISGVDTGQEPGPRRQRGAHGITRQRRPHGLRKGRGNVSIRPPY